MEMQPVDVFIGQMKNIFLLVCGIVGKTQQSSHLFCIFFLPENKNNLLHRPASEWVSCKNVE